MRILVTGGNGFIGRAVVAWLLTHQHEVILVARQAKNTPRHPQCKLKIMSIERFTSPEDWYNLLDQVEGVINCLGVLEANQETFNRLHCEVPRALALACSQKDVQVLIQLSAMGNPSSGEFIASKHRGDQAMMDVFDKTRVVRPSVVLSTHGSYGGTSLMRGVASLPILPLPKGLTGHFQPILLDDLCEVIGRLLTYKGAQQCFYPASKDTYELGAFFQDVRRWLGWKPAKNIHYPKALFNAGLKLNQRLSWLPFNQTLLDMLENGNQVPNTEHDVLFKELNYPIQSVKETLAASPSYVQDRWHAKLFWLIPFCFITLFFIWVVSGMAGWFASPQAFTPLLSEMGVSEHFQPKMVLAFSLWDWLLALGLLIKPMRNITLYLMLLSTLGYSAILGSIAPSTWLDPLGGMIKNLAIIPIILCCLMFSDKR